MENHINMEFETISRNRSAENFFLMKNSDKSMAVGICLKARTVDGEALRIAAGKALERFPLIGTAVAVRDGSFYYAKNTRPIVVAEGDVPPVLFSEETNYHLACILYKENRIYIPMHHSLSDLTGLNRFIETMLYYYFEITEGITLPAEGASLLDGREHPEDEADPFEKPYEVSGETGEAALGGPNTGGLVLPENGSDAEYSWIHMNMDAEAFLRFAKSEGTTPLIAATLLMIQAVREELSDTTHEVVVKLPVDMRPQLGVMETLRNCVVTKPVKYSPESMDGLSFREQAAALREQVKKATTEEVIRKTANEFMGYMHAMDEAGSIEGKKELLNRFRKPDATAFLMSYARIPWSETIQNRIREMHALDMEPYLKINMTALKESFCLDFIQSFPTTRYVEALEKQLNERDIHVSWERRKLVLADMDLSFLHQ